jgi:hypothetical protein
MKQKRKLTLNREKIGSLTNMHNVQGGKEVGLDAGGGSTEHNFTCGWCTQISKGGSCVYIQDICV